MKLKLVALAMATYVLSWTSVSAQGQANIWYFGQNAGLDFNGGAPVVLTNGQINTIEGCASICDANGNLLFYTDGQTVYNRLHAVMTNGTGLLGRTSSTQTAMIIPRPGSTTQYYIFTTDAEPVTNGSGTSCSSEGPSIAGLRNGLRYSIVDMSAGANGSVVAASKNTVIQADPVMEAQCIVPHSNGTDYWLITHDVGTNMYRARQISSAGVGASVNSAVGHNSGNACFYIGSMKSNSCYTQIAMAYHESHVVEVMGFNNTTGVVGAAVSTVTTASDASLLYPYGLEFSPNGNYLYYTDNIYNTPITARVRGITIGAATPTPVAIGNESPGSARIGAMQLGPDGRIYVANHNWSGSTFLGVLATPNNIAAPGYTASAIAVGSLSSNISQMGLPTYVKDFVANILNIVDPGIVCPNVSKSFSYTFTGTLYGGGGVVVDWDWGDATAHTTSTSTTPASASHTYTANGTYTITLTVRDNCGRYHTDTRVITVYGSTPTGTLTCSGSNTLIMTGTGTNSANYNWYDPDYVGTGSSVSQSYTPASSAPNSVTVRDMTGLTTYSTLHPYPGGTGLCYNTSTTQTSFTTAKALYLQSVSIHPYSNSPVGNTTITVTLSGSSSGTYTFTVDDNSVSVLPLNLVLNAGSYTLTVSGNGTRFCGTDLTAPTSITGVATITGGNGVSSGTPGGAFYNFKFTDYNSCSPAVTISRVCALPIELLDFYATPEPYSILLNWITSVELNSKQFEIERSSDGINFVKIGIVKAAGESHTTKSYSYEDPVNFSGVVYYRLKLVDIDGQFSYSKIVLTQSQGSALVYTSPNPFHHSTTLFLRAGVAADIRVTNTLGAIVAEYWSVTEESIELGDSLPKGVYIVTVTTETDVQTVRIVKE